ncbi:hypothetical protein Sta7437_2956 [Stanieria cyanosphaera PCC 7437]|uniref:Uncharacterized protein n=1 Tax=Stanieria cyanosphaera (strain ATCC 29371 / PCC 7437) TaxID=111780 RepID=K9XV50_STAC7|nr:hypothetical protein [Stanieria cyanosphaera]AFZ36475.1 hypothetical protein Sta7437_2956 [Stanieria cyanosphaera PCC 7437]
MNQTQNEILQQNLNTLTIIIRHWLLILEQLEILQSDLENVPLELEILQQQLEQLESYQRFIGHNSVDKYTPNKSRNQEELFKAASSLSQHQQIYGRMQTLLESFDHSMIHWIALEEKVANLIALREVIEALQERIYDHMPSDFGEELLKLNQVHQIPTQSKPSKLNERGDSRWRKYVVKIGNFTSNKLAMSLIILGLFFGWGITDYILNKENLNKQQNNEVNRIEKPSSNQK